MILPPAHIVALTPLAADTFVQTADSSPTFDAIDEYSPIVATTADPDGMAAFYRSQDLHYLPKSKPKNRTIKAALAREAQAYRTVHQHASRHHNLPPGSEKDLFVRANWERLPASENHTSPNLGIARIGLEQGFGLFALQPFEQGDWIGEYTGYIVSQTMLSGRNVYAMELHPWNALLKNAPRVSHSPFAIDGERAGSAMRFANHIDDSVRIDSSTLFAANMQFAHVFCEGGFHTLFFARRAIEAGEELRFDYGHRFWSHLGITPDNHSVYRLR